MQAKTKTILTFFVLVALIGGLYLFSGWFSRTVGYVVGEDERINLAQCLNDKGAVFYVTKLCPDCDKQAEIFGDNAFSHVDNIINCDGSNSKTCEILEKFPVFEVGGKFYYGVLGIEELGNVSKCRKVG